MMIKNFKKLFVATLIIMTITGCSLGIKLKRDTMEDITIYTTTYPINYILNYLYGENSTIKSIYPAGVNLEEYTLSNKKLKEYSKSDLFVYNSLDKDKDYAVKMINYNQDLKMIEVTVGMNYNYSIEELWLNPYNYLMIAQNIKSGLKEYITNPYLIKEIEQNYDDLKYDLSRLDANLKDIVKNANYTTIVADSDMFKFLEKYNITVISLEENDNLTNSTIEEVKKYISEGKIRYIYTANSTPNATAQTIIDETQIEAITINSMNNVDGQIKNSNENYLTIMSNNIDAFKKELYK